MVSVSQDPFVGVVSTFGGPENGVLMCGSCRWMGSKRWRPTHGLAGQRSSAGEGLGRCRVGRILVPGRVGVHRTSPFSKRGAGVAGRGVTPGRVGTLGPWHERFMADGTFHASEGLECCFVMTVSCRVAPRIPVHSPRLCIFSLTFHASEGLGYGMCM